MFFVNIYTFPVSLFPTTLTNRNMPIPISVPSVLWNMSSNSNRPRWKTNCTTSIQTDINRPIPKAVTNRNLFVNRIIKSIPMGINSTTFQKTSAIRSVWPPAIAL